MSLSLLRSGMSDKKYERILNVAEASAERGADLIGQVLSFTRGMEITKQPLNIKYLISDVFKIVKQTFPKSIEIKSYSDGGIRNLVGGDYTQLLQMLLNICVNARDAMQGSGELTISTRNILIAGDEGVRYIVMKSGEYVEIVISDTGPGIPPDVTNKIFDPLFTTKEQKGTGLVLSIAYGIVKEHRGYIHVESTTGKGSRFIVYMPVLPVKEQQNSGAYDESDIAYGKGETVLVVDDEASVLDVTRTILEEFGYKVLTANNGQEALDIISDKKKRIEVAIVDMMMPVIGGKTVIRLLKKKRPTLKIISVAAIRKRTS